MKKYCFSIIVFVFSFLLIGGFILAQEAQKAVVFPIPELGNCANFKECADFCDKPENFGACSDFSEKYGLAPPEKTAQTKKVLEALQAGKGPMGCTDIASCKKTCDETSNPEIIKACVDFATENNLFESEEERKEAAGIKKALEQGVKPPPCSRNECPEYCSKPENLEKCIEFGKTAGIITKEEEEMIRKTGGEGPGGCKGKDECEEYCNNPANMEECMEFSIEHNLMSPDEMEEAKKMLTAIKKGVKPPNCRGKEDCDIYCAEPEHQEECINFAVAAGFMSREEAEKAKEMGMAGLMSGPGGCKGKAECEAYCEDPNHMEECVRFAEKTGFMNRKEAEAALKMAKVGTMGGPGGCKSGKECMAYCDNPAHRKECMDFALKAGIMDPEEAERAQKMESIRERGGPGGCKSEDECMAYCNNPAHIQECMEFGKREGLMDPERARRVEAVITEEAPCGCNPSSQGFQICLKNCCRNMANMRKCTEWGEKTGSMKKEDIERNKELMRMMKIIPKEEGMPPEEFPSEGQEGPSSETKSPKEEMFCRTLDECNEMLGEMFRKTREGQMPRQLEGFPEGPPERMPSPGMPPPLTEEMKRYCEKHPEECGPPSEERMPFFEGAPPTEKGMPSFEEIKKLCAENPENEMCRKGFRPPMSPEDIEGMPPQGMPPGMPSPEEQQQRAEYCKEHPEDLKCRAPEGKTPWGEEYKPSEGFRPPEEFKRPEEGFRPPEEYKPPEGFMPPEAEGFRSPEEGYRPPEGFIPPEGYKPPEGFIPSEGFKPPEEEYRPPEGFIPPEEFRPPEEYKQMPPEEIPPEGTAPLPPTVVPPPPSTEVAPPPEEIPQEAPQSFLDIFMAIISMALGIDR